MPNLYIIAGCNGAGKTTASLTILPEIAKQRVADRVRRGGHNISDEIVERRYYRGISNLLKLYIPVVDNWILIDNMDIIPDIIAKGAMKEENMILNSELWNALLKQSKFYGR